MANITTNWTQVASRTVTLGVAQVTFYLDAKYTSQSVANNTTTGFYTRLRSTIRSGDSASGAGYAYTCSYCSSRSGSGVWTFENETIISSSSQTISHNQDGTKSLSLTATAKNTYFGLNITLTGTATLPSINRLAYITSASDFNDEQNPTIEFANPANYTAKPFLKFYDNNNTLVYTLTRDTAITSPYTWSISSAERTALRNACYTQNSYTVAIGLDTYSGSTLLGSNSTNKTFTIINSTPTLTYTTTELNAKITALYGASSNYIIQNASQIRINATPTLPKGGQVVGIAFNNYNVNDENQSQGAVINTSPYQYTFNIGSYTGFKLRVYDKRNVGVYTFTKTLVNYLPIRFNSMNIKRLNPTSATLVLNADIQYYQQTFNTTANAPIIKWKIDDGSWTTLTSSQYTIDNVNHKITITNLNLTNVLPYTSSGNFTIYVEDKITSFQNSYEITKGIPTFDAGDTDFKVNGTLYVADTNGQNKKNIMEEINKKLDKTSVKTAKTTSATDTYSCNYVNNLEKDAIKLYLASTSQTITGKTTTKLNLVKDIQKLNKFTVSSNSVVIPNGVTNILVSANVYWNTGSNHSDGKKLYIYQNNTVVASFVTRENANYIFSSIPATYLKVSQGDTISLRVYNDTSQSAVITAGTNNTYLNVIEL